MVAQAFSGRRRPGSFFQSDLDSRPFCQSSSATRLLVCKQKTKPQHLRTNAGVSNQKSLTTGYAPATPAYAPPAISPNPTTHKPEQPLAVRHKAILPLLSSQRAILPTGVKAGWPRTPAAPDR
jgi:hypothetical protein